MLNINNKLINLHFAFFNKNGDTPPIKVFFKTFLSEY